MQPLSRGKIEGGLRGRSSRQLIACEAETNTPHRGWNSTSLIGPAWSSEKVCSSGPLIPPSASRPFRMLQASSTLTEPSALPIAKSLPSALNVDAVPGWPEDVPAGAWEELSGPEDASARSMALTAWQVCRVLVVLHVAKGVIDRLDGVHLA